MFFNLINNVKRRLIEELQESFSRDPIYGKIVPFIQNRFAFDERPQYGIVVKGSSANKIQLAANNFLGTIKSHVMLAYIGRATYPLEWVREDLEAVRQNGDRMPTPAGVYYIEIQTAPTTPNGFGSYALDPLLTITNEPLLHFLSGVEREAQLQYLPVRKTLRLWQNNRFMLVEGTDYVCDYTSGAIRFISTFPQDTLVTADYRHAGESIENIPFQWNTCDFKTLPGVVLAFGKRAKPGDKVAVVVSSDRVDTAEAYGVRWDVTFDLEVIVANDVTAVEEISDLTLMTFLQKRSNLSFDGLEITEYSMGGEAEETYDETGDVRYYTTSLSITIQSESEYHIPLPLTISKVTPSTEGQNGTPPGITGNIPGGLYFATVPVDVGRNNSFERIL